jgi:hypothetical protein
MHLGYGVVGDPFSLDGCRLFDWWFDSLQLYRRTAKSGTTYAVLTVIFSNPFQGQGLFCGSHIRFTSLMGKATISVQ